MKIWTNAYSAPRGIMKIARVVEEDGWDGLSVVDSQNLFGDSFVTFAWPL